MNEKDIDKFLLSIIDDKLIDYAYYKIKNIMENIYNEKLLKLYKSKLYKYYDKTYSVIIDNITEYKQDQYEHNNTDYRMQEYKIFGISIRMYIDKTVITSYNNKYDNYNININGECHFKISNKISLEKLYKNEEEEEQEEEQEHEHVKMCELFNRYCSDYIDKTYTNKDKMYELNEIFKKYGSEPKKIIRIIFKMFDCVKWDNE